MCFSPEVSFGASIVLAGVGATSIASAPSQNYKLFAATPLLFAAQQAAEGMVWRTMNSGSGELHQLAVNSFLAVALIIWPMWLPYSLLRIEENRTRQRILQAILVLGIVVAIACTLRIVDWHPSVHIAGRSLQYDFTGGPETGSSSLTLICYVLPTAAPLFISSAPRVRVVGFALIVSLIAAIFIQREALTSVWCFFASFVSALILLAVRKPRIAGYSARHVRCQG